MDHFAGEFGVLYPAHERAKPLGDGFLCIIGLLISMAAAQHPKLVGLPLGNRVLAESDRDFFG